MDSATPLQNPPVNPIQTKKDDTWINPLLIVFGFCVIVVLSTLVWFLFFQKNANSALTQQTVTPTITPRIPTTIRGTIEFQGYASEEAYLVIVEKGTDKSEFKSVVTGLIPQSGSIPWSWDDATSGTNYQLEAQLKVRGKTIQESPISLVSAPATNVSLSVVSEQSPPNLQITTIAGSIHLDGYIPAGSTLALLERQTGKSTFTMATAGIDATSSAQWSWAHAVGGKTYDLQAELLNSAGGIISSTPTKTITAPSAGLLFAVSSTAQPTTPVISGLSGTVTINGSIPSNSYLTLAIRPTGTNTFNQVVNNFPSTNGTIWNLSSAQSGKQYDVQAYLWVNGKPYTQSNIITITAPSANDTLILNAGQQLASPDGGTINVVCNGQQNNVFQATINYNTDASLQNPRSFTIVVTLASQGNQVLNTTLTPGVADQSQSLTTSYIFTPGTTYYAQYAYTARGNTTLSPLSPAIQFSCR